MPLFPQTALFPMLRKELVERAARRRTYVVRVLYAVGFLITFTLAYQQVIERASDHRPSQSFQSMSLSVLGSGDEIFASILRIQAYGIFLFLPAMMCGLITDEKERGTLSLLMLTDISPREAILQKYFAGLIPMLSLLMLTLPVGGLAYLLGGLTISTVLLGSLMLVLRAGMVAAVSLACSSYCRTTLGAFMSSYGVLVVILLVPSSLLPAISSRGVPSGIEAIGMIITAFHFIVVIVVALGLAIYYYTRRAHVAPRYYIRRFFLAVDRKFKEVNARFGSYELIKDTGKLPDKEPLLWREKQRRQLGNPRYLIRWLLVVETLAMVTAFLIVDSSGREIMPLVWIIGMLIVVAQSSNLIVSERLSQTLDVLLTTPLSGAEIVSQKARSLAPLLIVVASPILTLSLMTALADSLIHINDIRSISSHLLFLRDAMNLIIFLPLAVVIGLAIGLSARSRSAATMKSIGVVVLWWAIPYVLWATFGWNDTGSHFTRIRGGTVPWWIHLGPSGVIAPDQVTESFCISSSLAYWFTVVTYAVIVLVLYLLCLRRADRSLGRAV